MKISSIALLLLVCAAVADAQNQDCADAQGYRFVCGPENAEDLVLVPGTRWIIASGMAPGAGIYLINSDDRSWDRLYPGNAPLARQNMRIYGACPGSPDPNNLTTHGLNLRPGRNGHSTLYAVGHGAREAIEVFDVDAAGARPELTWIGCVAMPDGLDANSVASFSDGSLVATVLNLPGNTFADLIAGKPTGAVYEWSPGDDGFELVRGTELPGDNGIEVSADDREIYVVSSGLRTVVAFSHSNPASELGSTTRLSFIPDNVHMGPDGRLITAGMSDNEPACGGDFPGPADFSIESVGACPRGFVAVAIDPATMAVADFARGPANPDFSNATMALQVGTEVWVGTFSSRRIGIWPLE